MEEKMNEKTNEQEEEDEEEEEEEETLLKEFEDKRHLRKNQEPVTASDIAVDAGEVSRFNVLFQKMLDQNKKEGGKKKKKRGARKEPEPVVAEEKVEPRRTQEEEGPLLAESLERRQTMEDLETLGEELVEEGTSQQEPPLQEPAEKTSAPAKNKQSKLIDLKDMLPSKTPQVQMPLLPTMVEAEEEMEEADDRETKQKMIIKEAFAGDDVISDFLKEKRKAEDASKPEDISLVLPGWGDWGGTNLKVSAKKRRKFTLKAPPAPPRRDRALPNVIINEKRNIAFAAHQVNVLPFTFSSHKHFESAIRAPVGNTWNPELSVRKLTAPRVVTKRGHIIEPITEDVFQKHNAAKKAAAELKTKTDVSQKHSAARKAGAGPKRGTKPDRRPAKRFGNMKKRKPKE